MLKIGARTADGCLCLSTGLLLILLWFWNACENQARTHLLGLTIITHFNQHVAVWDWSDHLREYNLSGVPVGLLLLLSLFYIGGWIVWRLFGILNKTANEARGFDVVTPGDLPSQKH